MNSLSLVNTKWWVRVGKQTTLALNSSTSTPFLRILRKANFSVAAFYHHLVDTEMGLQGKNTLFLLGDPHFQFSQSQICSGGTGRGDSVTFNSTILETSV
jgi:hypothetical protein